MIRRLVLGFVVAILLVPSPPAVAAANIARHHHDRGGDDYQGRDDEGGYSYRDRDGNGSNGDCQSGGCGNKSHRCERSSGDCRSSFSPGPFKDSPVTIWFCPQPNSCNQGGDQPPQGGKPLTQDPQVRREAHGVLSGLFSHLGSQGSGPGANSPGIGSLGGGALSGQLVEFMEMPVDLARIFLDMSVQLTDLVLTSLEEAGIVLVKGLSPM